MRIHTDPGSTTAVTSFMFLDASGLPLTPKAEHTLHSSRPSLTCGTNSTTPLVTSDAFFSSLPPLPLRRSSSTISLGDDCNTFMDQLPSLSRNVSDDFLAFHGGSHQLTSGEQDNSFSVMAGEVMGDQRSPTNVDDLGPAALERGKSQNYLEGEVLPNLSRSKSEDFRLASSLLKTEEQPSASVRVKTEPAPDVPPPRHHEDLGEVAIPRIHRHKNRVSNETKEEPVASQPSEAQSRTRASDSDTATCASPKRSHDTTATSSQDGDCKVAATSAVLHSSSVPEPRRKSLRNLGKTAKRKRVCDDDWVDSDDEYMPGKSAPKSKKTKKTKTKTTLLTGSSPASSSSKSSSTSAYSPASYTYVHSNRGAHVKGRPEMQEAARKGQEHWARKVQELRVKWSKLRCEEANAAFKTQLKVMTERHIKNQHECLLRALHMATALDMIDPHGFNLAEGESFLGWVGFDVRREKTCEFRKLIESMFPSPLLENTLHNTFRRAGLVPDKWSDGWMGLAPFMFKPQSK